MCWFRFDHNFQPPINNNPQGSGSNSNSSQGSQQPSALIVTPETVNEPVWYPDPRATHHVTSDPANIAAKSEYVGFEKI